MQSGRRYVELAGGPAALLAKAHAAFAVGDYRWVAELVNHLVFADPTNVEARDLQADTLEQLGYRAESGPWRAFYLTAAMELRNPRPPAPQPRQAAGGQLRALPADSLLDSLSVRLNGPMAGALDLAFNLTFTDADETFTVTVENAVLHHRPGAQAGCPAISLERATLIDLVLGQRSVAAAVAAGTLAAPSGAESLESLLAVLDRFDFWFEIVTP